MSETHANAYKMEAQEKRAQAAVLLADAEKLDPTPAPKPKASKPKSVSRSAKNGKFVGKDAVKKNPDTTVTEKN